MCKRMALIAGITACLAICNGADAGMVVAFFVPSAPSGPSMPGPSSSTDALGILTSAGSLAYDGDGDGWADAGPGQGCNHMGYVVMHHSNWRRNVHLFFFDWGEGYAPFWVGGDGGSDGDMYSWPGLWPWDIADWDSPLDLDYEFGSSENPNSNNSGGFGVGEGGVVPEPGALTLLIMGGVGMLLRRRTEK